MKALTFLAVLSVSVMALIAQDTQPPADKVIASVMVSLTSVRVKAIERAGKTATARLERLMADSKKAGSDLGVESAKQALDDVASDVQSAKLASVGLDKLVVKFKGHAYLPIALSMSYSDAAKLCASLGGHLANIETKEELEFLKKATNSTNYLWCGAARGKNGWVWDNNKSIDNSLWSPNSFAKDKDRVHVVLTSTGLVAMGNGDTNHVICEWNR
jgi:hypothetical protein